MNYHKMNFYEIKIKKLEDKLLLKDNLINQCFLKIDELEEDIIEYHQRINLIKERYNDLEPDENVKYVFNP